MAATATPAGSAPGGIDTTDLKPGLADPVHDSQKVFRALLEAMARPGRPVQLAEGLDPPFPLDPATAAAVLTLCDHDTPLWVDWIADTPPVRAYVSFHCGCPLVERSQQAAFGLVSDAENMPRLGLFAQGLDKYPDRSATLVLQVPSLSEGPAVQLSGPGIDGRETLRAAGLPDWFWNDWRLNAAQFPLGVDLIVTSGTALVGLPRSIAAEG